MASFAGRFGAWCGKWFARVFFLFIPAYWRAAGIDEKEARRTLITLFALVLLNIVVWGWL